MNKDDGQVLMPIFTDVQEFLKFQNENRDMKYTMGVVEAARIPEAMGRKLRELWLIHLELIFS